MIEIIADAEDDVEFIETIQNVINGAASFYKPAGIYVVRINTWFDHKWLHFSGKVLGALGVWKEPLTVPPFHPRRVLSQNFYLWEPGQEKYLKANERAGKLHGYQTSSRNLRREIGKRRKSAMYVWYSGDTKRTGNGSLMVYVNTDRDKTSWFVSFSNKNHWQTRQYKEISLQLIADFEEAGKTD